MEDRLRCVCDERVTPSEMSFTRSNKERCHHALQITHCGREHNESEAERKMEQGDSPPIHYRRMT
jgi:hypothetical protein